MITFLMYHRAPDKKCKIDFYQDFLRYLRVANFSLEGYVLQCQGLLCGTTQMEHMLRTIFSIGQHELTLPVTKTKNILVR